MLDLETVIDDIPAGASHSVADIELTLPLHTDEPITISGDTEISLHLPSSVGSVETTSGNGFSNVAVYEHDDESRSVPLIHDDGSVQVVTVLDGVDAPTSFHYKTDLPIGSTSALSSDGDITLYNADGSFIGGVAPAWAIDANGVLVPTRYGLTRDGFTQVVDHGAGNCAYPITADPWLGINLINYWRWSGSNIEVHVTPWMAAVSESIAATEGWRELRNRQTPHYRNVLGSKATYMSQWLCHAAGKSVIGFAGFIGADARPAWGLEGHRAPLPSWQNPIQLVSKNCNW